MTRTARHTFSWRRTRIFLAVFALLALVLGPAAVDATVAGWKDSEASQGSFTAGALDITDLKCSDRENAAALGLLERQVQLDWDAPQGAEEDLLEYVVTWKQSGLLGGSGTVRTDSPTYRYTAERLSLLTLTVQFTVTAESKNGSWTGPTQNASATSVSLLGLGLILSCN